MRDEFLTPEKTLSFSFEKFADTYSLAFYDVLQSPGKQNCKYQNFKFKKKKNLEKEAVNHFKQMQAPELKYLFLHRAVVLYFATCWQDS